MLLLKNIYSILNIPIPFIWIHKIYRILSNSSFIVNRHRCKCCQNIIFISYFIKARIIFFLLLFIIVIYKIRFKSYLKHENVKYIYLLNKNNFKIHNKNNNDNCLIKITSN